MDTREKRFEVLAEELTIEPIDPESVHIAAENVDGLMIDFRDVEEVIDYDWTPFEKAVFLAGSNE